MDLILRVTSDNPRAPLAAVLRVPLGLDVWEVKPDYIVLSANEAQADRLRSMGYAVDQLQSTESYLAATTEAFTAAAALTTMTYHSAETLEQDLRALAESAPEIAELRQIGQSVEERPILALRIGDRHGSDRKLLFMGCHHAREWIAVEVPFLLAEHLSRTPTPVPSRTGSSTGELWVAPMVNPDGHEHCRVRRRLWRKNRRRNHDGSVGVDPNRNYGYMWGTLDVTTSSHTPRRRHLRRPAGLLRAGDARGARPDRPRALPRCDHLSQLLAAHPVPVGLHRRPDRRRCRPHSHGRRWRAR